MADDPSIQKPEVFRAIRDALQGLPDLIARRETIARARQPRLGSPGAQCHETELGQIAWNQATLTLSMGLDHLNAWSLLHGSGWQPTFAHNSLLRAAIEGAVVARWLCEPVDDSVRLARAVAVQRASYRERDKFEKSTGRSRPARTGKSRSAWRRLAILERAERRYKIDRLEVNLIGLCAAYASDMTQGELFYRLLSSFAHAKEWALLATSDVRNLTAPGSGLPGSAKLLAGDLLTVLATQVAADLTERAVKDLEAYSGY